MRLLATVKRKGDALVTFCCNLQSTLAQASDIALDCSVEREACRVESRAHGLHHLHARARRRAGRRRQPAQGLSALERFIAVRGDLFRSVYYHRTVRAIDLTLQGLFVDSKADLFPGNPLDHLDEYLRFTEWSLLVRVADWHLSPTRG